MAATTRHQTLTLTLNSDELVALIDERVQMALAESATEEEWLNSESAAQYLDCPVSRIHDLVMLRKIRRYKDGTRNLFRRADLRAYIEGSR